MSSNSSFESSEYSSAKDQRIRKLLDFERDTWTQRHIKAVMKSDVRDFELLDAMERYLVDDDNTALMFAASVGNVKLLRLFLDLDICITNSNGWTALSKAAENNHQACI